VSQFAKGLDNFLLIEGRGDADPIGDNATVQGRAQNRRVEITVAQ
jgi:flagellar motor protein MotB